MLNDSTARAAIFAALAGASQLACDDADVESTNAISSAGAELPASIAGVALPDSDLAHAAAELALAVSPPFLGNHLMRTYAFGALLLQAEGRQYDPELAFLAVMLHDLGLVEQYISADRRFELDSADAAAEFLNARGLAAREVELVWEAIALHLSGDIASRMAPEIAFVSAGAAADAVGVGLDRVAASDVQAILEAYPRLGFKQAAVQDIIDQCERKPLAYALHPWAEVGRRHLENFPAPIVEDLILAAPFED
jgi:hypothetical protein